MDDAALWRYMDFARFIALLERRALFFSSIRAFADRFEGALTSALIAQLQHEGGTREREWRGWNAASYLNCWNQDDDESVALWNMYTSPAGGVAIRSSVASIRAALDPPGSVPTTAPSELYIGRVRYVDFATAEIPHDNAFWPLVHKRLPYAFEREVRLVLWPRPLIDEAQSLGGEIWVENLPGIAPVGYDVPLDPARLIEQVVVAPQAPDWLLELVGDLARRYRLDAAISRSTLDEDPP